MDVDEVTQLERLMRRNSLTEQEAHQRMLRQWPLERKRPLASLILDNRGSLLDLHQQIDQALLGLEDRFSSPKDQE